MTGNTLDKQTAAFIAAIASNLPPMRGVDMQTLIERPKALQQLLRRSFAGLQNPRFIEPGLSFDKLSPVHVMDLHELAKMEIVGENPFSTYECSPFLGIGAEYSVLEKGKSFSLRPHLQLVHQDAAWAHNIPCKKVLDRPSCPGPVYALQFLQENIGVADFIYEAEVDYAWSELYYWLDYDITTRVRCPSSYTWDISLVFAKPGKHTRVFQFKLWKREIERTIQNLQQKAA